MVVGMVIGKGSMGDANCFQVFCPSGVGAEDVEFVDRGGNIRQGAYNSIPNYIHYRISVHLRLFEHS